MKKILLSFILLHTIVYANTSNINKQITDTKIRIAELQATLVKLENSLTSQTNKDKKLALAKKPETEKLKMHTEFGFISTKGNTDTTTYNLDTKIKKVFAKHELTFLGDGEYASDTNARTKNKYFLEFDYGNERCKDIYLEYIVAYKYDEFSGYDYRFYTGPGLKYKAMHSDTHTLNLGSAIFFSKDKTQTTSYDYTSYRAKLEYSWQMLRNLKFEETLSYRTDITQIEDYSIYSKTAFISKISDIFSVGINYKIDYINLSEPGKQKADKTLSANLIADF